MSATHFYGSEFFGGEFFFSEGIGLIDQPGIGLAPAVHHPVDFVFSDSYMIGIRPFSRSRQMRVEKPESGDLQEILGLYAQWKKAA